MASATSAPPHTTSHLPLPQLSLFQCSICQTLPQPHHTCYHQHGHFYIGSTGIGIPHREHNRRAKLKQLQNNIPISAELSLRYWHSHNYIHHFTPIQLSSHDTYDQAWIQEHYLISNWMPTSDFSASFEDGNMPFTNHISLPQLDYIPSLSFAISPNTH